MKAERQLYIFQMYIGALFFFCMITIDSIAISWIECLNPEVVPKIISILQFLYKHKEFWVSILNPVSITMFLTGFIAIQNLELKIKRAKYKQTSRLLWCKYHLLAIYTPEELVSKVQIRDPSDARKIKAQLQKGKLEALINAIREACISEEFTFIESENIEYSRINIKIRMELRKIEMWAEKCLTSCDILLNAGSESLRIDMICPKVWLPEIDKTIEKYIITYYKGNRQEQELNFLKTNWAEREAVINSSAVNTQY